MCFSSHASSGTQYQLYTTSSGGLVYGEQGLPQEAVDLGYTSNTAYQDYLQQKLTDEQIAAQEQISAQTEAFNQQSLDYQKQVAAQEAQAAQDQADRQTTYDQGRAQILSDATDQINKAFAGFTPDYFTNYAKDYMSQVQDQLDYQKNTAIKDVNYSMARQGISDSQAKANQMGLLDETEGRTLADQTQQAQQAANTLQSNVSTAKNNLLNQVITAQSTASPTAASTIGQVNSDLNTQQQTISGISNSAADVTSSLQGVPTVSTLGDVFSSALSGAGSYLGGAQSSKMLNAYYGTAGLSGTSPSGKN